MNAQGNSSRKGTAGRSIVLLAMRAGVLPHDGTTPAGFADPLRTIAGPLRVIADQQRAIAGPLRAIADQQRAIAGPLRTIADQQRAIAGPLRTIADQQRAIAGPLRALADPEPPFVVSLPSHGRRFGYTTSCHPQRSEGSVTRRHQKQSVSPASRASSSFLLAQERRTRKKGTPGFAPSGHPVLRVRVRRRNFRRCNAPNPCTNEKRCASCASPSGFTAPARRYAGAPNSSRLLPARATAFETPTLLECNARLILAF